MTDRYNTTGNIQAEFEPRSNDTVLRNKLGITAEPEMADVELSLLALLYEAVIESVRVDQPLKANDLCDWHRRWLGNVYEWAGEYRSVNIGKGNFQFAACAQIPRLMDGLDSKILSAYTPCEGMTESQLADAIAIVHVELILIHPFREGNGRLSRLLMNVMALQAGWPELDFSAWDRNKQAYFSAIQSGLDDYAPMKQLVRQVLRESYENTDV